MEEILVGKGMFESRLNGGIACGKLYYSFLLHEP